MRRMFAATPIRVSSAPTGTLRPARSGRTTDPIQGGGSTAASLAPHRAEPVLRFRAPRSLRSIARAPGQGSQHHAKAASGAGLSRDEADELGRLYAEEAGTPYANADDVEHPDEVTALVPGADDEIRRAEEAPVRRSA